MKILIANPGSTSYKCKLYDMQSMKILYQAAIERIGETGGIYSYQWGNNDKVTVQQDIPDYFTAINLTIDTMKELVPVGELNAVGFKTVHAKGISGCVELTG